nr:MAG TPA: hypothetical protein [Caudoviricetes sp.]
MGRVQQTVKKISAVKYRIFTPVGPGFRRPKLRFHASAGLRKSVFHAQGLRDKDE